MRHNDNIKIINLNNEPITRLSIYLLRILYGCHPTLGIQGIIPSEILTTKGSSTIGLYTSHRKLALTKAN